MDPKEPRPDCAGETAPGERWEHGSDFHWPSFDPQPPTPQPPTPQPPTPGLPAPEPPRPEPPRPEPWSAGSLWNSGRDSLRALIDHRGWRRLWLPSYFCQDVVRAIQASGIETRVYADAPDEEPPFDRLPAAGAGEAVLVANYFGLRPPPDHDYSGDREIVEDHTHDPSSPWARASGADWCIASLRKTLPAPSGGALWSPRGHSLPQPGAPDPKAERDASQKLAAMLLKRLFLDGHATSKEAYRSLAVAAERSLGTGVASAPPPWLAALLGTFPVRRWRRRRLPNLEVLAEALRQAPGLAPLAPADAADAPFCAFLTFADRRQADSVRQGLISRRIYPARLWDLDQPSIDGVPPRHVELAARSLALHCDQRYGAEEMRRVAEAVLELCR